MSTDVEHYAWHAKHLLEQAARGDYTAWSLSGAMEVVANHYRSNSRISEGQRDDLLSAAVRAQLGAITHLPCSYSRDQIAAGMQFLAYQIAVWAEPREMTARRRQHFLVDLDAWARMFRNDMHNISLVEQIEERAAQRREAEIEALRANVGGEPSQLILTI
ncbi:hypothetical protein NLM16_27160 [Bradyrhizobium brasilense]|uniref:hypothetical protein n=1 Tax=Bradyrhizobium brasilense TaxID=1419277 RepID=UPI00287762A7|nr:hypothetical protein [Bradyrhizobium brasilense]MCP3417793.1 hypothetical protein [Bradyrhizobium brasilense]